MDEKISEPKNPRSPFSAIRAIDYTVIDMPAMRRFYENVLAFPRHAPQKFHRKSANYSR